MLNSTLVHLMRNYIPPPSSMIYISLSFTSFEWKHVTELLCAGLWKSVLQTMCKHRYGRDDRRKEVHRMFREEIQPKVT